jgi:pentatricopeptide repeat protein
VEAYGAMLKAYSRKNDVAAALDLVAEFRQQGGDPDERLISTTVTACVKGGEFRKALQVNLVTLAWAPGGGGRGV